jgi:hypothetical protein
VKTSVSHIEREKDFFFVSFAHNKWIEGWMEWNGMEGERQTKPERYEIISY